MRFPLLVPLVALVGCATATAPEQDDATLAERGTCRTVWYADRDGDGFGQARINKTACTQPIGYVDNSFDCADRDELIYPGAAETCDGVDEDCDGGIDEGRVCSSGADSEVCGDGIDQEEDGIGCEPRGVMTVASAVEWTSGMAGSGTGWDVEYAGDVDGDGNSDWLAGGPAFWSGNVGETRLVYGDGRPTATAHPLTSAATFHGEAAGDAAGYASASAGDVDDDGYDDFLVTAPGSDLGGTDAGGAFLVYGGSDRYGHTSVNDVGARFIGTSEGEFAGASVMSLGHFDGDAYGDFAIGALGPDLGSGRDQGAVYVYYGDDDAYEGEYRLKDTADAVVRGTRAWSAMADPNGIASADLDADGLDDLLVGAWSFSTAPHGADVFLFYGDDDGLYGDVLVTAADARFHATVGWWSYIDIGGAGDVNGDGYDEFLVGLPDQQASGMGSAYLFDGGSSRREGVIDAGAANAVFQGSADNDYELTVTSGDLDGDALSDVVIGSPWNSTRAAAAGAVYAWYGGELTGTIPAGSADARWYGGTVDGLLGSDLAAGGDIDDDGYDDLLMGAYGEAMTDGGVWLVMGAGF